MAVSILGVPLPAVSNSMQTGPTPATTVYHPIAGSFLDEHLPWGVDSPHNLTPMQLHPTQQNNGPSRPQRIVNKLLPHGNPLNIFKGYARMQTAPSQSGK